MERKRKEKTLMSSDDGSGSSIERDEIMKLTRAAKSWEFTCSFCFKKFPSAQAMGGHQNAHRNERLEEKRLFVRDPISYRKRNYLKAMKLIQEENNAGGSGGVNAGMNNNNNGLVMRNFMGVKELVTKEEEEEEEKEKEDKAPSPSPSPSPSPCIDDEINLDLTLKL